MKQVVATALGFYNGSRVREGKVFSVPDSFKGSWVVDVNTPAAVEPVKVEKVPQTLSEMAKQVVEGPVEDLG